MSGARDMGMITSIRAPLPVAEVPKLPEPVDRLDRDTRPQASTAPVAAVEGRGAVQQMASRPGANDTLLQARLQTDTQAADAAEAARQAYIQASRAAGVSPLPLP